MKKLYKKTITQNEYLQFVEEATKSNQVIVDKGEYYVLEKIDNTPTKKERINSLEQFLSNTDWYATRYAETGVEIPADVKQARQEAREEISKLRGE